MGALQAVVFDWAGTVIDPGSQAPMGAFVRAFASFGVSVTVEEARGPMGMAKRDHILALLALPSVAAQAAGLSADDVLAVFEPMTVAAVADHAALIDGVLPVVADLRARGMKVGTTTGYTRAIMERVLPLAAAQGFIPDSLVCAGDLPEGRPAPLMMYRTFLELGVWPAWSVVKVDDTGVGIGEGRNAGCWTVAVALSGNAFGLTPAEAAALPVEERARREAAARDDMRATGAHYVIDSVADIGSALDDIEQRLARGERP